MSIGLYWTEQYLLNVIFAQHDDGLSAKVLKHTAAL